jgi:hypothetical protein
MSRSESIPTGKVDWRGWLSLGWMVGFGLLYLAMIVREKAPGLLARLSRGL